MGILVIRNLDQAIAMRLSLRAAARSRSMEEEARQILIAALPDPTRPALDLGSRIRARFAPFGDVQIPIEPRNPDTPSR